MVHRFSFVLAVSVLASDALLADTIALWTFDELPTSARGAQLQDSTGNGFDLELGDGKIVASGKFGGALACPSDARDFVARRLGVQGHKLNLGNFDWTIEWWQRREGSPAKGQVDWAFMIFDEAANPANPHWEAGYQSGVRLLGAGLWRHDLATTAEGQAVYWNCFVDKYDEVARIAFAQDVQPRFYSGEDSEFHHVAWVYDARIKRLMYFEDGQGPFYIRDGAAVTPGNQTNAVYGLIGTGELSRYPAEYSDYGQFGEIAFYVGERRRAGTERSDRIGVMKTPPGFDLARRRDGGAVATFIDEMRVSDEVRYRRPFSPPQSFASDKPSRGPRLVVHPRRFNFTAFDKTASPPPQTLRAVWQAADDGKAVDGSRPQLIAESDVDWLQITPADAQAGTTACWHLEADQRRAPSTLSGGKISIRVLDSERPVYSAPVTLFVQIAPVSSWRFDEPRPTPTRFQLEDDSANGFDLQLGPGGAIVAGKCGGALSPLKDKRRHAATRRAIDSSHLNLGDFDWTFEGWFKRGGPVRGRETLFELRENIAVGPYPHLEGVGQRTALFVEEDRGHLLFVNEPSGCDGVQLASDPKAWIDPSGEWFHLSLAYNAATRTLGHWINGRLISEAVVEPLQPLPSTGENVLSLGSAVSGDNAWNGLIDDASISAHARELKDFSPPGPLAGKAEPIQLAPGPHLFFDRRLVDTTRRLRHQVHTAEHPVDAPLYWNEYLAQHPNGGDVHLADLGSHVCDPRRRFLRYQYVHSYSAAHAGGIYCYYGPTRGGPWISYEHNPVLPYIWAGQPHSTYSVSDHWPVMYDDRTGQLVMIYKTYPLAGQHPILDWYRDERFNYQNRVVAGFRRCQGIAFSNDGLSWRGLQQVFVPDDADEGETQFQSPMLYRRGDLYIALIQMLRDDVDRSIAWLSCATSRDLLHWERRREPFIDIPRDARRGDRWISASGNSEIYADERWMYFPIAVRGSHKPPRSNFQTFARLPVDRFASFDSSDADTGTLTTPIIELAPDVEEMQLNGATAHDGELRVRVLHDRGQVVPGYNFEDCTPITGDAIKKAVQWRSGANLNQIRERPIRFEFSVRRGRLYAFYLLGAAWRGEKNYVEASKTRKKAEGPGKGAELSTAEIRRLLDIPQLEESTTFKVSPADVRAEFEIPEGFGYAGDPRPVTLEITPPDEQTTWSIVETIPWLSASPREGRGQGSVSIRFHGTYLSRGAYLGKIFVQASGATSSRVAIPACIQIR